LSYNFRDLLALEPLTADELSFLLDQSKPFQEIQKHPLKKLATLRGKRWHWRFLKRPRVRASALEQPHRGSARTP